MTEWQKQNQQRVMTDRIVSRAFFMVLGACFAAFFSWSIISGAQGYEVQRLQTEQACLDNGLVYFNSKCVTYELAGTLAANDVLNQDVREWCAEESYEASICEDFKPRRANGTQDTANKLLLGVFAAHVLF